MYNFLFFLEDFARPFVIQELNPISPRLFGGLITRGDTKYPPDNFRNTYSLKLKLGQSDAQSMLIECY